MERFRRVALHFCCFVWCSLALFFFAIQAAAIPLEKPIDCQVGVDCFIQNYVDLAPGPEYADDFCGSLSYDKHKGIDFRVPYSMMQDGVLVKAAAPGIVRGMRDGMQDISFRQGNPEAIKDRECGNGVVLVHADGMETQYCHMRKGSLRVKVGERVTTGQPLGFVGLSGETEFPHLHFEVRIAGKPVSPFTGKAMESGCTTPGKNPLWTEQALAGMPYTATGGLDVGFNTQKPDIGTLFVGGKKQEQFSQQSPQIIFWAGFWGVRKGDTVSMRVDTPSGDIWTIQDYAVTRNQAQLVVMLGKKRTTPWTPGTYIGKATLVHQHENGKKAIVIPLIRSITIPSGNTSFSN